MCPVNRATTGPVCISLASQTTNFLSWSADVSCSQKEYVGQPAFYYGIFLTKETGQGTISENRALMYEEAPSNQMMIGWY